MIVRELITLLGFEFDSKGFERAKLAYGVLKTAATAAAAAAAAVASAVVAATVETVRHGDAVAKAAARIGIGTQALQELSYAASLSGSSAEELELGLRNLSMKVRDLHGGSKEAAKLFAQLGVSTRDASGATKPLERIFVEVAGKLRTYRDEATRAGVAQELFGRSGTRLIPLLLEGREGIEALRREAHLFGGVMSDEAIAASVSLGDNIQRLTGFVTTLWRRIAADLIPDIDRVVRGMLDWIRANEDLIDQGVVTAIDLIRKAIELGYAALRKFVFGLGFVGGFLAELGEAIDKEFFDPIREDIREIETALNDALAILNFPLEAAGLEGFRSWRDVAQAFAEWLGLGRQHLEAIVSMLKQATLRGVFAAIPGGAFLQGLRGIGTTKGAVEDAAGAVYTRNQLEQIINAILAGEIRSQGPMSLAPEVPMSVAPPGFRVPAPEAVMPPNAGPQITIEAKVEVDARGATDPAKVGEAVKQSTTQAIQDAATNRLLPHWRRPGTVKR